jgi:hypothetical protein
MIAPNIKMGQTFSALAKWMALTWYQPNTAKFNP